MVRTGKAGEIQKVPAKWLRIFATEDDRERGLTVPAHWQCQLSLLDTRSPLGSLAPGSTPSCHFPLFSVLDVPLHLEAC